MSHDDIDRLIADRRLAHQVFDDGEIAGFLSKAIAAFADSQVADISRDTALQTAYRACLQAAFAVLAARNLRIKSTGGHFIAFYAMRKLDEAALGPIAVEFDALRATRSASVYEPTEDEAELARQLTNAEHALERGLPVLRAWIVRARPGVARLISNESDNVNLKLGGISGQSAVDSGNRKGERRERRSPIPCSCRLSTDD